jgi:hypothetical protein
VYADWSRRLHALEKKDAAQFKIVFDAFANLGRRWQRLSASRSESFSEII